MLRAAVLHAFGQPLVVEELELDPPKAGELAVRMAASGVCHSDLHVAQGIHPTSLPVVLGHEGAGVVEEVGPGVTGLAPGDHVLLTWLPYCGHCRQCVRGRPNRCENTAWYDATMEDGTCRFHLNGRPVHHYNTSSFAERSVVPARTAVKVDPSLPLTELALMGCAVMTGVGAVLNTAHVRPGDTVAVVGCGGVGLNVVQGARIAGAAAIVAVDVVPGKLELARELGATHLVDASAGGAVEAVLEFVPGGVDHAFEALGRPETIETTLALTGRGGQAVLIGMAPPDARVSLDALTTTLEERCVRGSWYGSCVPLRDLPLLVELYRSGRLRLDPLITRCALDDVNDAFRRMDAGETARSVIVYDD
ncbi:MAG TPA: Zn-dependent alcohol dehydrogenase [Gaiellaceae bacterium]|jgi:S-(hydroxymethyl)glutathione dehydrogenase/alcohol dehydrogenase